MEITTALRWVREWGAGGLFSVTHYSADENKGDPVMGSFGEDRAQKKVTWPSQIIYLCIPLECTAHRKHAGYSGFA